MIESAHIDRVLASVRATETRAGGASADSAGAEPTIARSWRRCVASYGLEPHRTPPPTILTQTELKDFRAPIDDLIGIAQGEIDRLFARIGPTEYVVLFTDAKGVTVDFRCTANLAAEARGSGLYLGSIWAETDQGTNGVGTCLYENRPLSIVMDDHFSTRNTALTCTVAPIIGADGRLAAILDVSTGRPTDHASQAIMREIVAASARRIENLYFAHRHAGRTMIRLSGYRDFADTAAEARLALDDAGRIVEAGSNAQRLLGADGDRLAGRDAEGVLGLPLRRLLAADGALAIADRRGGTLYARVEPAASAHVSAALRPARRTVEARDTSHLPPPSYDLAALAGGDPAMLANVEIARRVLDHGLPIVLCGETGSGKGLFAKAMHAASRRAAKPFVAMNCAAIPRELVESELFGYRPGAFTGASASGFKGRLLEANGGTLFLDEIGDMPMELQTRLLQVLSDQELTPIGATRPIAIDIAVISATLHDLADLVRKGGFREDLFFRLSGVTLTLPALRHRRDRDALIRQVLAEEAARAGKQLAPTPAAIAALESYDWPGNLRELRHVARFVAAMARGGVIAEHDLPPALGAAVGGPADAPGAPVRAETRAASTEARMIRVALERTGWNVTATAALLDVSRATLHRKIRRYALARNAVD